MSLLDTLRRVAEYSARCSGRSSLHDEHPPPHRPRFRHFRSLPGGDSRSKAADIAEGRIHAFIR